MTLTSAIQTIDLTKVYGSGNTEVVAMRNVSITVRRGEVVALLGPSGSGKSTFLTAVGLIHSPTSGRIFINGQLVADGPRSLVDPTRFRRENIGYVFQKSNLIPFLSARENVQVALEMSGWRAGLARKRSLELLDYLGVVDRANNMPSALSGGQQQRIAIARALANQPSIILADEPTAALDKFRGRQVMELFAKVAHERNAGVIVVTHDERTLDVFDAIFAMDDGMLQPTN